MIHKTYTKHLWFVCTLLIFSVLLAGARSAVQPPPSAQAQSPSTPRCISVVGDSIAAGTFVAQVPNIGFAVLQGRSVASVLQARIAEQATAPVTIHNRSVAAANLAANSRQPYRQSAAYTALLQDNCDTVLVLPWNNDLKIQRPDAAQAHVQDIAALVRELQATRPDVHVLLFSHYWFAVQPFVEGYGVGLTHRNFRHHHTAFMAACRPGGVLAATGVVSCVNSQALLQTVAGDGPVLVSLGRAFIDSLVASGGVLSGTQELQFFFANNPNGTVIADGVHLGAGGKELIVAEALRLWAQGPTPLPPPVDLRGIFGANPAP